MIKLNAKDVQKAFEKLGFTVKQINDTAYRCEHKQYINVNFIIDAVNKELQISAYFTGKKTVDRNEFLTALNTCNRRTTIVKFMVDDDGPSGGFEYDVLEHIIKEFQNEIRNNLSLIQPFVE
jgi:hypothetical protein